jgi:hypothetical protein
MTRKTLTLLPALLLVVGLFLSPTPAHANKCKPDVWGGSWNPHTITYGSCSGSHYKASSSIQTVTINHGTNSVYQVQYYVHYCGYTSAPCSGTFKTGFETWSYTASTPSGFQYDCDGACYKVHAYMCKPTGGWDAGDSTDADFEFDIQHVGGTYYGSDVTAIQATIEDWWVNGTYNASSPATHYQISTTYPCNPSGYDCGTCQ